MVTFLRQKRYILTEKGIAMAAGIDDISVYIPKLYVDASDFAEARGLDPQKLERTKSGFR